MAIILPQTLQTEGERPQGQTPWLWLLELEVYRGDDVIPSVLLRITDAEQPLQWPLSDPDTTTWYPFPFTHSPIEQDQEGNLPQLTVSIDNTSRMLMRFLHDGDGFEGNRATLFLVPEAALGIAYPNHEFLRYDLVVADASATDDAISLRLALPNFFNRTSPTDRYIPERCRWDYGSGQCGYVLNAFAAFASCTKTLAACIERGGDLVARGLPAVLPGNYGGHPGISTQR